MSEVRILDCSMNFQSQTKVILLGLGFGCLAACGGSGSSGFVENGFVLNAGEEGSGLPFAGEGGPDDFSDLSVGDTFKVRYVRYENIDDGPQIVSTTETITLTPNSEGGEGYGLELSLDDRLIAIDLGTNVFPGALGLVDLSEDEFLRIETDSSTRGTFSAVPNLYNISRTDNVRLRDGFFVLGYNTALGDIGEMGGSANYNGEFEGYGARLDDDNTVVEDGQPVRGEITFAVDFEDGTLDGDITGEIVSTFADLANLPISGSISETTINGNSFETTIPVIDCGELVCTSDSTIGGGFYGPDADEVSGIIAVDVTGTNGDTGTTERFIAAAGFVTEDP